MDELKLAFNNYEDVTITMRLYGAQLEAIKKLAVQNNFTFEDQFSLMMNAGSINDIQKKIDFWQK